MKYWEIIAVNLGKAGWTWGCVEIMDCIGREWVVDAYRDSKARFVVRCRDKLTAFLELERECRHSISKR
jgi:hypothetical protein